MDIIIKKHNNLVSKELGESEKGSIICLTDLLISKENIAILSTKQNYFKYINHFIN